VPDASTVFTTERLVVRDWADDEAQRMYDMYSRDDVVRFLGSVPTPMRDTAQAAQRIAAHRARNADIAPCGWWAAAVRDTGVVAGTVAVVPVADHPEVVEVAWHLHPDSQGRGYATEAAAGALRHAEAAGLADVIALTDEANTPSQAVCRRLGLEVREVSDRYYGKRLMVWGRPTG
jgi:RimJ/RimL family protein N-acetyltransferase